MLVAVGLLLVTGLGELTRWSSQTWGRRIWSCDMTLTEEKTTESVRRGQLGRLVALGLVLTSMRTALILLFLLVPFGAGVAVPANQAVKMSNNQNWSSHRPSPGRSRRARHRARIDPGLREQRPRHRGQRQQEQQDEGGAHEVSTSPAPAQASRPGLAPPDGSRSPSSVSVIVTGSNPPTQVWRPAISSPHMTG